MSERIDYTQEQLRALPTAKYYSGETVKVDLTQQQYNKHLGEYLVYVLFADGCFSYVSLDYLEL